MIIILETFPTKFANNTRSTHYFAIFNSINFLWKGTRQTSDMEEIELRDLIPKFELFTSFTHFIIFSRELNGCEMFVLCLVPSRRLVTIKCLPIFLKDIY